MTRDYILSSLWRYPVKSMAGEELEHIHVTPAGLPGDRAYALVDAEKNTGPMAKRMIKSNDLLKSRAAFTIPPEPGRRAPAVRITLPNGAVVQSDQSDAAAMLREVFGPQATLLASAPAGLSPDSAAETAAIPAAGTAPAGTLFDFASIHIVTTSTLRSLEAAYPEGRFAINRFRPNLVVDCPDESGFVENAWVGRTLAIGPEMRVKVSIPCPRCTMMTLPQVDLPGDPAVLRTVAQTNMLDLGDFGQQPCAGVYAEVVAPGTIRRGDAVRILD